MIGRKKESGELIRLYNGNRAIRSTLITTFGLKRNEYSGVFANVLTLDDLFR